MIMLMKILLKKYFIRFNDEKYKKYIQMEIK